MSLPMEEADIAARIMLKDDASALTGLLRFRSQKEIALATVGTIEIMSAVVGMPTAVQRMRRILT